MPNFVVTSFHPEKKQAAKELALKLKLPFVNAGHFAELKMKSLPLYTHFLILDEADFLGLGRLTQQKFAPFYPDFLSPKLNYRQSKASLRNEKLARALGVKPQDNAFIVDATAGFGRDGFILAKLGFSITLLERCPIIHALLQSALKRASSKFPSLLQQLTLHHADANEWLRVQSRKPDIIYLDPMFPPRQKKAAIKKEMAWLQEIVGNENSNNNDLLSICLSHCQQRVIVKRPRHAPPLSPAPSPTFSLNGRSARFDVYLVNQLVIG